ncbi:MAG: efflux RND transporter periplasmic adaptor subunit [Halieaceae bacterium]|jgi:RND family efflux transporter MFP subunit|nr:efflux RND transporter periplasmic adaptor subunit [Halieaceae bacterium]
MTFIDNDRTPPDARTSAPLRTLALVLPLAALLAACSDDSAVSQPASRGVERSVPVVAEPVSIDARRTRIEAVGTARARRSVEVFAEAAGEVTEVNFQPGDRVSAGDVLIALDSRDETLALRLAELRVGEAQRQLKRYNTANSNAELTVPESTVDTAATALETAIVERDIARLALERRAVTAAFDGFVGISDIDVGDRIDTTTLITTLDDRSALLVTFDVPEAHVNSVQLDDAVTLEAWDAGHSRTEGRVVDIGSRIDPVSRAFATRAEVRNDDDRLRPGMSFRVQLDLEDGRFPAVPELAVQWGADGAYVWAAREGRARRVPVRLIQRDSGRVLVEGELMSGDQVIAEGVQAVRENAALRIMDAAALARDARGVLTRNRRAEG